MENSQKKTILVLYILSNDSRYSTVFETVDSRGVKEVIFFFYNKIHLEVFSIN